MKIVQRQYQIVECNEKSYWIEITTKLFGYKIWINHIGDYEVEYNDGEIEEMPFATYIDALEALKEYKK